MPSLGSKRHEEKERREGWKKGDREKQAGQRRTFSMVPKSGALARRLSFEAAPGVEAVDGGGGGASWPSKLDMISPKASLLLVG